MIQIAYYSTMTRFIEEPLEPIRWQNGVSNARVYELIQKQLHSSSGEIAWTTVMAKEMQPSPIPHTLPIQHWEIAE